MARTVILDELHLTIRVPADRSDAEVEAIRQVLDSADFLARLRVALRAVVRAFPDLAPARITVSR